ncbi:MAG: hypothetical protein JXA30_04095 [Deltaproteobacteria bacterium]|nr:hypothetical protein [Deltaproteobacteria bacterium]
MKIIESNGVGRRSRSSAGIITAIIALGVWIDSAPVAAKSSMSEYQRWAVCKSIPGHSPRTVLLRSY